ncbi:MAG: hypothetical protein E7331_05250 [Clostridiales bacterium]|nr:hypothetical protein [Clostridiales bacterium]
MREACYRDAARFLGAKTAEDREKLMPVILEAEPHVLRAANPRHILLKAPVRVEEGQFFLAELDPLPSCDLCRLFEGADQAVAVAITLGADMDSCIRRQLLVNPGLGAAIGALASAYVDDLLDQLMAEEEKRWQEEGLSLSPRFSPGYGDVPLSWQKPFTALLHTERIGIRLTQQCLMIPEKSITALTAVRKR